MNFKKIALGLALFSICYLDARASTQIKEEHTEETQSRTSSTYSVSSQLIPYEELSSPEDKYKANLRSFKQDRQTSLQRMETLARDENYEDAQLYLAECYRMGVLGKPDISRAIEMNTIALKQNNSFTAAVLLASIFWADGDYENARENCFIAKKIASEKNIDSSKVNLLLEQIKSDER